MPQETTTEDLMTGVRSIADVATPRARQYMGTMAKHFGHKRPTSLDETSGHIGFDGGVCRMKVGEGMLTLTIEADDAALLERLQDVVASHLLRFAFREDMVIDWRAA